MNLFSLDFKAFLLPIAVVRRYSVKKGNLKNFAKFTGKHLASESVFKKFASFMPATLLKKRSQDRCFPVTFFGIFKITFFL